METLSDILFIRHAKTDMAGRFCGHADPGLNEEGRAHAAALAAKLAAAPIVRMYASDLRRARETAEVLASGRGLPVEPRAALREIGFGQWEGRRWAEIEALDPEYAEAWMAGYPHLPAPMGESFAAFTARVEKEIYSIIENHRGLTAVITHAGVLRVVLTKLLGSSEAEAWAQTQPYCCVVPYACETVGEKQ